MFRLEFDPPGTSSRLAVILVEASASAGTEIRPEALDRLDAVLDSIGGEDDVAAVVIAPTTSGWFATGFDPALFLAAKDRRRVEETLRRFGALLHRIEKSRRPFVAALSGACTGAGLELAIACRYRVADRHPETVFSFPEVAWGLVPAGGGLTRLPRAIGARAAADLVLSGRAVRPAEARSMGLVDEVVEPETLIAAARRAAARLGSKARTSGRWVSARRLADRAPLARRAGFARLRRKVRDVQHGLYPAPLVALDVMERGLSMDPDSAFRLEAPAVAELAVGDVARSLMSVEMTSRALRRRELVDAEGRRVVPPPIERIGVVGGGFMGTDIAIAAAQAGLEARIREVDPPALARTLERAGRHFARWAEQAGPAAAFEARTRLSAGTDLRGFETVDVVVEAVPESLRLKQSVFEELESRVGPETVLASNTLALPIDAIGRHMKHRSRLAGLHFFAPVGRMSLVEIVRTPETSSRALATCIAFARRIGKTPVIVRDAPGFFATRVLAFYLMAAFEMIEQGYAIEEIDFGAQRVGWRIGPLRLVDELGLDVCAAAARTLAAAFPDRARTPPLLEALLEKGRTGRRAGRGLYRYATRRRRPDPEVYDLCRGRVTRRPVVSCEELGERLTLVAAMEAVRCLEERVIEDVREGDAAAVLGIGYPALRGGPFRHLCSRGLLSVRARLASLADRVGPRYAAPALLRELADRGHDFETMGVRP